MTPTERLILDQQPYLKALARMIAKQLPQHVDYDELVAFGQVGLAEAARGFDASRGVTFTTFAHYRIRGAIFDGLRKMTWLPPAARRGITEQANADEIITATEGKAAGDSNPEFIARQFTDAVGRLGAVYLLSNLSDDESTREPEDRRAAPTSAESRDMRGRLREAIEALPADQASLVRMLYLENKSMAQVGATLGKNKSTICRRHADAIDSLRKLLGSIGATGGTVTMPMGVLGGVAGGTGADGMGSGREAGVKLPRSESIASDGGTVKRALNVPSPPVPSAKAASAQALPEAAPKRPPRPPRPPLRESV